MGKHNGRKGQRMQRDRMFAEHPYCENCGVKLIHPKDIQGEVYPPMEGHPKGYKLIKKNPHNMATIQHVYTRGDPRRKKVVHGEVRHLLWCFRCNMKHAEEVKKNGTG